MMRLLFLLVLLLPSSFISAACLPSASDCSYYLCREKEVPCGEDGYYLSFGLKYCEEFIAQNYRFTQNGQKWLEGVRLCLQERMEQEIAPTQACHEIRQQAFASHANCYLEAGYCDLGMGDKLRLLFITRKELFRPLVISQGLYLEMACATDAGRMSSSLTMPY